MNQASANRLGPPAVGERLGDRRRGGLPGQQGRPGHHQQADGVAHNIAARLGRADHEEQLQLHTA
jgi:hypothetical protein